MIQSGDGDWIIDLLPSGIRSQMPQGVLIQHGFVFLFVFLKEKRLFIWREPPRQMKKYLLRVLRASVVKNISWPRVATTTAQK